MKPSICILISLTCAVATPVQATTVQPSPQPSPSPHLQTTQEPPPLSLKDLPLTSASDQDWIAIASGQAALRAQPEPQAKPIDLARSVLVDIATHDTSPQAKERAHMLYNQVQPEGSITTSPLLNEKIFSYLALVNNPFIIEKNTLEPLRTSIRTAQQENGSFAWSTRPGSLGDTNMTGFALQALLAGEQTRETQDARTRAFRYLKQTQNGDGGFPVMAGMPSDANSTAVVIMALVAAKQPFEQWSKTYSPWRWLANRVLPSGHVEYEVGGGEASTSALTTAQASLALHHISLLTLTSRKPPTSPTEFSSPAIITPPPTAPSQLPVAPTTSTTSPTEENRDNLVTRATAKPTQVTPTPTPLTTKQSSPTQSTLETPEASQTLAIVPSTHTIPPQPPLQYLYSFLFAFLIIVSTGLLAHSFQHQGNRLK